MSKKKPVIAWLTDPAETVRELQELEKALLAERRQYPRTSPDYRERIGGQIAAVRDLLSLIELEIDERAGGA